MKILLSTASNLYLERVQVGHSGKNIGVCTADKDSAMSFYSDLQIGYFLAKAGFELDDFEVIDTE